MISAKASEIVWRVESQIAVVWPTVTTTEYRVAVTTFVCFYCYFVFEMVNKNKLAVIIRNVNHCRECRRT